MSAGGASSIAAALTSLGVGSAPSATDSTASTASTVSGRLTFVARSSASASETFLPDFAKTAPPPARTSIFGWLSLMIFESISFSSGEYFLRLPRKTVPAMGRFCARKSTGFMTSCCGKTASSESGYLKAFFGLRRVICFPWATLVSFSCFSSSRGVTNMASTRCLFTVRRRFLILERIDFPISQTAWQFRDGAERSRPVRFHRSGL
mmetsp:Transcript_47665/g.85641  ORF Transcript_47665/g.85641 Transcript_47665/m.85641 type:complete len:207 (+) Transcript_47665:254-874(+)